MQEFTPCLEPSPLLRKRYLLELEQPQEYFVEEMVGRGQFWTHDDGSYGVLNESTLVEFFSTEPRNSLRLLLDLHSKVGFSKCLVKSYDRIFRQSCEQLGWKAFVGGYLFRNRIQRKNIDFPDADMRVSTPVDVLSIWEASEDFFESQNEVVRLVKAGKLWTVRVAGEIAGCGVANQFAEGSKIVDVGMMVAPNFRRKGLGTYIVSEISSQIEKEGLRPIAGCAASNIASRATLEKAGFVTEHELLSFAT